MAASCTHSRNSGNHQFESADMAKTANRQVRAAAFTAIIVNCQTVIESIPPVFMTGAVIACQTVVTSGLSISGEPCMHAFYSSVVWHNSDRSELASRAIKSHSRSDPTCDLTLSMLFTAATGLDGQTAGRATKAVVYVAIYILMLAIEHHVEHMTAV